MILFFCIKQLKVVLVNGIKWELIIPVVTVYLDH
jgi:hypothetical protein